LGKEALPGIELSRVEAGWAVGVDAGFGAELLAAPSEPNVE